MRIAAIKLFIVLTPGVPGVGEYPAKGGAGVGPDPRQRWLASNTKKMKNKC